VPGSPLAAGAELGRVGVLLETLAFIAAVGATLLGDEITRRGWFGRRIGMVVVIVLALVHLLGATAPA
jgi:hypothetical protein